jgi:hypothetical protein
MGREKQTGITHRSAEREALEQERLPPRGLARGETPGQGRSRQAHGEADPADQDAEEERPTHESAGR